MATGTLTPSPYQVLTDANDDPISGGLIQTYVAGTTTRVATYTDVTLTVANTNPIVAGSDGRWSAWLSPGASYKFVFQNADGSAVTGKPPVDNISAVPATSSNIDISGVAGENITAGEGVYLSDGSGSKSAGQWYGWDSSQPYSSVVPDIGIAPAAIASGATGTIRLGGQATGLTSLTLGTSYYVGTAGALTSTAPVLSRLVGVADSTTTLVFPNPREVPRGWVNDFRLTLTTALPVTVGDVTAATAIFCTPYTGNRLDLPDALGNPIRHTSAQFTIAVPATTSTMYDIFVYSNAGVATLELLAWTNDTTRATAVIRTTTGRLYKTGDLTRMYIGSFRTTAVSGQTEDSFAKRYIWNYYNRTVKISRVTEATTSWSYSVNTFRQANAATTNQLDIVIGFAEVCVDAILMASASNDTGGSSTSCNIAIGFDSTTTAATGGLFPEVNFYIAGCQVTAIARFSTYEAVGRHTFVWLEKAVAVGVTTWAGVASGRIQSGISATFQG